MVEKSILKSVIIDNQIEVPKYEVVPRKFISEQFDNYVLVGVRRAGKSFLLFQQMQQLLSQGVKWDEMLYINFEDERLTGFTASDFNLLLELHWELYDKKPRLFLDEIQNIAGWEKFARQLADTNHQVCITGNNAKMLSADIQTTLGDRYISLNVYPYSFDEFLAANGVQITETSLYATSTRAEIFRLFNSYFYFGGFPEGATLGAKRNYLTAVYQKIYLGDIATRYAVENTFALRVLFNPNYALEVKSEFKKLLYALYNNGYSGFLLKKCLMLRVRKIWQ